MSDTTKQSNIESKLDDLIHLLRSIDMKFDLIVNILADVIEQDDNAVIHSFDGSMVRDNPNDQVSEGSKKIKTL